MSATVHRHSLESGAVHNLHKISPRSGILHDTVASVRQERFERRGVRGPKSAVTGNRGSFGRWRNGSLPRTWSGSGRFRDLIRRHGPDIAAPERHVLTSSSPRHCLWIFPNGSAVTGRSNRRLSHTDLSLHSTSRGKAMITSSTGACAD